jgi:hypothetical protein
MITLSDLNNDIPGLDRLLRYKKKIRTLWQETKDPECKMAVNWVSEAITRMIRKKALERWKTKLANTALTPRAIWPIGKPLANRVGPRAPTAIQGPSGPKFQPVDKANAIADCSEKQFTPRKLCDENHERQVEATVQALLLAVVNDPQEKVRPCDLHK